MVTVTIKAISKYLSSSIPLNLQSLLVPFLSPQALHTLETPSGLWISLLASSQPLLHGKQRKMRKLTENAPVSSCFSLGMKKHLIQTLLINVKRSQNSTIYNICCPSCFLNMFNMTLSGNLLVHKPKMYLYLYLKSKEIRPFSSS